MRVAVMQAYTGANCIFAHDIHSGLPRLVDDHLDLNVSSSRPHE